MSIPAILLVGCGRMGSAMLAGWREQGLAPSVAVDPAPSAADWAGAANGLAADAITYRLLALEYYGMLKPCTTVKEK